MTVDDPAHRRELARIRAEYARREQALPADFYSPARPANLFLRHGQERALLAALRRARLLPLAGKKILEVGCGSGAWLRLLRRFGAGSGEDDGELAGIELDAERLAAARAAVPGADLRQGDAADLPWPDGAFDLVVQSTVFTSILDDAVRRRVATEMLRVLAPAGAIVWYDFRWNNPRNRNVRGVPRRALRRLFPGCRVDARRVTLAPPLARLVVPRLWLLASLLERVGLFNSHDLAVVRPATPLSVEARAPGRRSG